MRIHVLLYDAGKDNEGIHSLELLGSTVVLMFENQDDADRYAGLLEAQDFPMPTVEVIDRAEIEQFCVKAGYEARFIESGFVPKTEEERLLLAPPESNREVQNWHEDSISLSSDQQDDTNLSSKNIEDFRGQLENLF